MKTTDRRDFFKTGALAGAGAMLAARPVSAQPGEGESQQKKKPLNLGIVTYNIANDWTLDDIFKNLEEVGIHGVELRSTHAHGVEIDLDAQKREEVKKRFADSPIQLVQIGSACEYHSPDPEKLKANIEETKEFLRLAHDLGAPGVKVRPNGLPEEVPVEKTLEQIGKSLHELGKFAEGFGVELRVECHGRGTSNIPNMKTIMDIADHPLVVANWNSNQVDKEDGGFEENFSLLADKIKHVHIVDLYRDDYPWRRLFERLQEIGYEGWCCAEIPGSSDPLRVLRYYKALFLAHQDAF
jgi:sugar phosphate isomerase/epimerase